MPRRNYPRRRPRPVDPRVAKREAEEPDLTPHQAALRLVRAGICRPEILGQGEPRPGNQEQP